MASSHGFTITTRDLIRAGLQDLHAASDRVSALRCGGAGDRCVHELLRALEHACDPDVALRNLADIVSAMTADGHEAVSALVADPEAFARLVTVLGASEAMGTLMRSRPKLALAAGKDPDGSRNFTASQRRSSMLNAVDAAFAVPSTAPGPAALQNATTALRREYRRQLAAIMSFDLSHEDPIAVQPQVSARLSDLADAALDAALTIAKHEIADSRCCRFSVIGMGKLGAHELNYVSDVDLIYVIEPAGEGVETNALTKIGTAIAVLMQKICQSTVAGVSEPPLWQIDTALRPEGKSGPLVRRLQSHRDYYEQWAENWEFQALLKARPVAGDRELGNAYMAMTRPWVWTASKRENFVYDCQRMRQRVERLIPAPLREREIKLGRGGLRDVEFTVQMLQLVHGRSDASLRSPATLDALAALAEGGYVSRAQASRLSSAYRFERVMEHRQQMWSLKRTHLFPDLGTCNGGGMEHNRSIAIEMLEHNEELRRLARAFRQHPEELVAAYDETRRTVRQLHMDIYYRPMLPISAQLDDDQISLSEEAAGERLESTGFKDPRAAMRHLSALTNGVSRAAKINRILLPAVLQWLGQGQDPDMGLLNWSKLEERFGSESEYLGFLRDSPSAAQRLCHVLANSRFLGDALTRSSESVTWLGDDTMLQIRTRQSLDVQCRAILERYTDRLDAAANSLRMLRRREIERIGLGWMSGVLDDAGSVTGMTDVYDALIDAALAWGTHHRCSLAGLDRPPADIAAIAMGRYGGSEVNFSSDADLILIYRPAEDADEAEANRFSRDVVSDLQAMLQGPSTVEPKVDLDFDLRPEGKNGPLIRSYQSCAQYYRQWSSTWERQALIRARFAAGSPSLAGDFLNNIANPLRYAPQDLSDGHINEIRTLKARMEAERLPRGVRRERHLKLGRGGLSDIEWTVQLLQLRHAGRHAQLRTTSTRQALDALEELALIPTEDAAILRDAWSLCAAARNGNYLWSGRAARADILPDDLYSLGGMAMYLGYDAHQGQRFENNLLALLRRCREVVERMFYGV